MIPITILVCDGDENDRMRTAQAFEAAHISNRICFVNDGGQLLDYLHQRGPFSGETGKAPRPSLILLDLDVPQLDEREALKTIKADPDLRNIPIVALAKSFSGEASVRVDHPAIASVITKPLTFAALAETMNSLGRYWLEIVELPPAMM